MKKQAPYGTWKSPIASSLVASSSVRLSEPRLVANKLYWVEGRPDEDGRCVICRQKSNGQIQDVLPKPYSARSKVHEYGGSSYIVWKGTIFFVNAKDQQIYALDILDGDVIQLTDQPNSRFADLFLDRHRHQILAVCESHQNTGTEPDNSLVRLKLGNALNNIEHIATGHDFYSNPSISPCGKWLSYLSWDHPNMPWDDSHLWLCPISESGEIGKEQNIAGFGGESIFQPQWSTSNELYWVSDVSNWWNIYRLGAEDIEPHYQNREDKNHPESIYPMNAEFATPQWVFGMSTYGFLDENTLFTTFTQQGTWRMATLKRHVMDDESHEWELKDISSELCDISGVTCENKQAAFIGAGTQSNSAIYRYIGGEIQTVTNGHAVDLDEAHISEGSPIIFSTSDGGKAHAFFYEPQNADYEAPPKSLPPVIVLCHGGPTGSARCSLDFKIQFWTNRGFAVLDVNYRGSTGYGRNYRHSLRKLWGVLDVSDLTSATEFVTDKKWVNPHQRIIKGSSAGGFSVLAALTDTKVFNAGCSLYGISDLEALARDTHKFEGHYLDTLIGPLPKAREDYFERSPIHKVNQINCPLIVFQGLEDKVVPPSQAEAIVDAVTNRELPVAYVAFADEAHGFRKAKNIAHQLEAELYFYQTIFELEKDLPAENPPVKILNLPKI